MASKKNSAKSKTNPVVASVAAPAAAPVGAPARAVPVSSTPVRNTPVPKAVVVPAKKDIIPVAPAITHEMIAKRAYEISQSGFSGSEDDNWYRAERELRGV